MLLLSFTLPLANALQVIEELGLAIIVFFPLATVLIGKILSDQEVRAHAVKVIKEQEMLFRNLTNSTPVGIIRLSREGVIRFANPHFINLVEYGFDKLDGLPFITLLGQLTDDQQRLLSKLFVKGQSIEGEVQILGYHKKLIWVYVQLQPEHNEFGDISGFVGAVVNIDERKRMTSALEESEQRLKEQNEEYLALNEELTETNNLLRHREQELLENNELLQIARKHAEESDKLKSSFLANMSHEIRTPMNAIVGFSEILMNPAISEKKQTMFLEVLNSSCHQLLAVINDVLDISKIETNQVKVYSDDFNLNKVIKHIHSLFYAAKKSNEISIVFGLTDEKSQIISDEGKIKQILTNLMSNANKFTEKGKIEMGYRIDGQFIEFYVKDSGIGISLEDQSIIFDRFRQADIPKIQNYGGTGLGLAICKAFVELLGGNIWVESKPDIGSIFYFTVPYKATNPSAYLSNYSSEKAPDFKHLSILLAEDEIANFYYIRELFEETGAQLCHVTNGLDAVNKVVDGDHFDIILVDIKMPILNGFEAAKRIKAIDPKLPIIAVTAYALAGDKEKAFAMGCDGYISKPIDKHDLYSIVQKHTLGLR